MSSVSTSLYGQLGKKHYLPPLHARASDQLEEQFIYLSTPSATPITVRITNGSGEPFRDGNYTISNTSPIGIEVGAGPPTEMFVAAIDLNKPLSDKGLILESTEEFYVTLRIRAEKHGGYLTSKGEVALGHNFRVGEIPDTSTNINANWRGFFTSFMATEDGTTVEVSDYDPTILFHDEGGRITDDSITVTLNAGESYVISGYNAYGPFEYPNNYRGFIGAKVASDKPIVVNTGSILGGFVLGQQDYGIDQLVDESILGTEYGVVRGNGSDTTERPLIVATRDNTQISINGTPVPVTLNAGDYYLTPASYYQGANHENMYIQTSEKVYVYQLMAGDDDPMQGDATMGMVFIPPLNCRSPRQVDNIPFARLVGKTEYSGSINVLGRANGTVYINGEEITEKETLQGSPDWVSYKVSLDDIVGEHITVTSDNAISVGLSGFQYVGGYGGFYSGFSQEYAVLRPADSFVYECDGNGNEADLQAWLDNHGGAEVTGGVGEIVWTNDFDFAELSGCDSITVTFTATDDCGPLTTQSTLTIVDTQAPAIDPPAMDETVESDENGDLFQSWLDSHAGAVALDTCSDVTWKHDFDGFFGGNCAQVTVVFTATDACGNSTDTQATFTIEGDIAPVIQPGASSETVSCQDSDSSQVFQEWLDNHGNAGVQDASAAVTWSHDYDGSALIPCTPLPVTFTVTDGCGNESSTTATFLLEDSIPPTITAQAMDTTVECMGEDNATLLQEWLDTNGGAQAVDDCGTVTWSNDHDGSPLSGCEDITVIFTAVDNCGNATSTRATFAIDDNIAPTITAPSQDMTVECDGNGNASDFENWLSTNGGASATDECSEVTWTHDYPGGELSACESVVVIFTATDACGNESVTSGIFTVEDTTPPVFSSLPEDEFLDCLDGIEAPELTVSDTCGAVITFSEREIPGICSRRKVIERQWIAEDTCGNQVSHTQMVYIACKLTEDDVFNAVNLNESMNNFFRIDGVECYDTNVKIFNRWGVLIFGREGYNDEESFKGYSDGRAIYREGEPLPTGAYFYVIEYLYDRGDGQTQLLTLDGYVYVR